MQTKTLLLVLVAALLAIGLTFFQYHFSVKRKARISFLLSFLRFLSSFGILLLLINPKFESTTYTIEKPNLVVLVDNSSSMKTAKNEVVAQIQQLRENNEIKDRFTVSEYIFGDNLKELDSLTFTEKNTNISRALSQINNTYGTKKTALLLITDGNQTIGEDYSYLSEQLKHPVYAIAVGDTTKYEDLKIDAVIINKFAFLNNKFPLEIGISYTGNESVKSTLNVSINGKTRYKEKISLSATDNVKTITTSLKARSIGIKNIGVSLSAKSSERNKNNNKKNSVIEVIDEKTNIIIISDLKHPDIGALKKAIESNEQRLVSVKNTTISTKELDKGDVFILYQPNPSFKTIYAYLQKKKASIFTILGEKVDMNFLNTSQNTFKINGNYPIQETFAVLNSGFSKFDISEFSFDDYPPLNNGTGIVNLEGGEALLNIKVMGKTFDAPLLFATDTDNSKELVLFGEHIWKWRMQSFKNHKSFQNFDEFIGKLMLYLASNKSKNRLDVDYQPIFLGSSSAKIKATYFDEAYVFDPNASLVLNVKNLSNSKIEAVPMFLKRNFYEADLSYLPPGDYGFTLMVKDETISSSGNFSIIDFDVEQQFLVTDYKKLNQLATSTNGALYFMGQTEDLLSAIGNDQQYTPTQKGIKNVVSLIDYKILLALITAILSVEWIIRKYNGLT